MSKSIMRLTIVVVIYSVTPQDCRSEDRFANVMAEFRKAVTEAEGPHNAARAMDKYIPEQHGDRVRILERMLVDENLTLALAGVWLSNQGSEDGASRISGFLEGRLRVSTPRWWTQKLCGLSVRLTDARSDVIAAGAEVTRQAGFDLLTYDPLSLSSQDGRMSVVLDSTVRVLPSADVETFFNKSRKGATAGVQVISCSMSDRDIYFCICSESGYSVACFDSARGSMTWQAEGWALGRTTTLGWTGNRASIACNSEGVVVYGAEFLGCYVEGYDRRTGKCHGRLSTKLWNVLPQR
jgi:hypothetical protein